MSHRSTGPKRAQDPGAAFLWNVGRRLDALNEMSELDAEQAAELGLLRVIWAHAPPTPAPRPPRRPGGPARLTDE